LGGGSPYPAITVTVNVSAAAPAQLTNQASVSGGGGAVAGAEDLTLIAGALETTPGTFAFTYQIGGSAPPAQPLTVTLSGGALSFTAAASTVSTWLTVSPNSGSTPANLSVLVNPAGLAAGTYSGTITLTAPGASNSPLVLPVTLTVAELTITSTSLATGQVGVFYSQTLAATGGTGALTWSVSSGRLPNGLALNPFTGVISGTPASANSTFLTFQVTDSGSPAQTATANLTMTIQLQGPVSITTTSLANGQVGVAYSQTLTAIGGQTPYTWSLTSGALPNGLTLGTSTGVIGGTPTATASNLSLTFRVTDSSTPPQTATAALTLTIGTAALSITTTSLPNAQLGVVYSQAVSATGGTGPYAWSATGLPANLSINATTGVITGTPAAAGTSTVSVAVMDSGSPQQTATRNLSLTVLSSAGPLTITTTSLATGQVGVFYSQTLAATGGTGALTWSVSSGRLPNGLALNPSTGVISGTPASANSTFLTFQVTDSGSPAETATVTLTMTVN
jgi:hypothetical protein